MNKFGWEPKHSEKYWTVLSDGETIHWQNSGRPADKARIEIGNCFKVRDEASVVSARYKALFKKL